MVVLIIWLLESTGISEPLPVAETFTFADEEGVSLSNVASLDTMVTVVDAVNFLKDYEEAQSLQETGESLGDEDQRNVSDLLVDQVEFADVILISKTDLVKSTDVERLTAILKTLNTKAHIIPIMNGQIKVDEVLNTGLFDFAPSTTIARLAQGRCVVSMCLRQKNMALVVSVTSLDVLSTLKSFINFFIVQKITEN